MERYLSCSAAKRLACRRYIQVSSAVRKSRIAIRWRLGVTCIQEDGGWAGGNRVCNDASTEEQL